MTTTRIVSARSLFSSLDTQTRSHEDIKGQVAEMTKRMVARHRQTLYSSSLEVEGMLPSKKACQRVLALYAVWSRALALWPNFFVHTGQDSSTVARLNWLWCPWLRCWWLTSALTACTQTPADLSAAPRRSRTSHIRVSSAWCIWCRAASLLPPIRPGSREVSSMAQDDDTDRAFSAGTWRARAPISGLQGAFLWLLSKRAFSRCGFLQWQGASFAAKCRLQISDVTCTRSTLTVHGGVLQCGTF